MRIVVSEPHCPKSVQGFSYDPEPNRSFDRLVCETESFAKKLNALKTARSDRGFVVRVSEDDMDSDEDVESAQEEEEDYSQICTCDDLYLSDDEFDHELEYMMDKMDLAENDHQTKTKEDIKNQVSVVEKEIMNEIETSRSALARVEKYRENRREVERRLDLQYKRKVAEALDTHMSAVQREHEIKSQIEERIIRSEEAQEEAKKRERANQEEKIRQEKGEKEVIERVSVVALALEKHRLKKLEELEAMNQELKSRLNQDFRSFERSIGRSIRQITGVKDTVDAKINEIVKVFKDPRCPLSISIAAFAKRMVSCRQNPFACSYIIGYVTSKFPQAMDILLAEFHKACIYTVPNHDVNSVWDSEAYERLDSTMRLYGALVQTDIRGGNATNIHGIEHGWAWLARFFNNISAINIATVTALNAFLQTAGFGLHQRYKSQFVKVMNVVREHFLTKLREEKDILGLDDRMYLKEPEGRTMKTSLLSTEFTAVLDQQNNNQHYQRNDYIDCY
ncbi:protein GLE1 [Arabidopsis lyrata subsp. lyrata]|uniref:protein GLE1 n=1 Tax=Arabidopsis lyrata subsp. lyrata TaxID=81972 RepID=UPI000A29A3AF|nr:protein GLE1 [Arabidopsis lyrata subsp. lyrata]|eukprot:XP_020877192.1 protein GLE1 [Arabidopsis lyrata subsp. lyrata]